MATTIEDAIPNSPLQPAKSSVSKSNASATNGATSTSSTATANNASATVNTNNSSTITTLSSVASTLQAVQATTSSDPVFSVSKVDEIKQAIANGTFKIDPEKVADGLLDGLLMLSKRNA
jgi:negative regulator of flagellin synthesis FlgM